VCVCVCVCVFALRHYLIRQLAAATEIKLCKELEGRQILKLRIEARRNLQEALGMLHAR
jgi:hypothetical protein